MSAIKDVSLQESRVKEILEQTKDTECSATEPMGTQEPDGTSTNKEIEMSAVDIEIDHQNIEPSMNQPSGK